MLTLLFFYCVFRSFFAFSIENLENKQKVKPNLQPYSTYFNLQDRIELRRKILYLKQITN